MRIWLYVLATLAPLACKPQGSAGDPPAAEVLGQ